MTIEDAVRNIMDRSKVGQSVSDVCQQIGLELEGEVRSILNRLYNHDQLDSLRGGGPYRSLYFCKDPPFKDLRL
jgi:hypothetical protein